ncbi:tRNA lysidine(34) synthetase TilS [Catenuloplanes atrovinosus]|uniref:tRNA(Ile)-lysidine synthase n=1 Tax=Catenuloplanes atrovinosus TaxID=137266 RepID=A0AAE3YW16_9ACTN|nr:tRNA lysidine(34) synthetase TilS [Catenuloplanes atrovinosus]MDR7280282.1 tRNA(Ile)-lysidine synthase [Catenuloplanes atrovinosus]
MARIAPPVAEMRVAVRRALTGFPPDGLVLTACSGGADSLALAAAVAFVAPRLGLRAGLVTVDHRLQDGSADRAAAVARWAGEAGLDPVEVAAVTVAGRPGGPEAAAREARYAALADAARRHGAAAVLVGHTRDDQAETVLLALARGAGIKGLAGMRERRPLPGADDVLLVRPLLEITREQTHKACVALGLHPWSDPHNADPAYARSRVRADALPALVAALGPRVVGNLARTAGLLAADAAALDGLARTALAEARRGGPGGGALRVRSLSGLDPAIRSRVLHLWARELGAPGTALSQRHVSALDALVVDWHGQGSAYLPGGIAVRRSGDALAAVTTDTEVDQTG